MRFTSPVICCALLTSIVGGCASGSINDRPAQSQSHLTQQSQYLAGALQHLSTAQQRLQSQSDPQKASEELAIGVNQVEQANVMQKEIQGDVTNLGGAAESLQKQIDSHRDDLLGPRGKRIRNRIVVLTILATIGWGLLQLGPLFGGPFGGGVIIFGHLLTAFTVPLFHLAGSVISVGWKSLIAAARWCITALGKLADAKKSTGSPIVAGNARA